MSETIYNKPFPCVSLDTFYKWKLHKWFSLVDIECVIGVYMVYTACIRGFLLGFPEFASH